jgi:formamidopyrimidine-DNA glycosylase
MPELPEVETTRRGITPHLVGRRIASVVVREPQLRWPVPAGIETRLAGQRIEAIERRAKYLLLRMPAGTLILHLGMSGSLRVVPTTTAIHKHDHVDLILDDERCLRLRDPRRFGAMLWTEQDPQAHPLLASLGPEPLTSQFEGAYLFRLSRGRRVAVKTFIMNSQVVVGVGNIYANEALFGARIDPRRAAGRISRERYDHLADMIKTVLVEAIGFGGTTLRDFVREDGRPGYFRASLKVYGHADKPCPSCGLPLRSVRLGQRATVFCSRCQR